jgi:hypothetical protein
MRTFGENDAPSFEARQKQRANPQKKPFLPDFIDVFHVICAPLPSFQRDASWSSPKARMNPLILDK